MAKKQTKKEEADEVKTFGSSHDLQPTVASVRVFRKYGLYAVDPGGG